MRERERERERECHGVEQYIRLFSSFRRIPIILLDNIILGNGCFWILAKQISCRIVHAGLSGAWLSRLSNWDNIWQWDSLNRAWSSAAQTI
jgi:hypothetical protein